MTMLVTNQWNPDHHVVRFSGCWIRIWHERETRGQAFVACTVAILFLPFFMIVELGINGCRILRGCLLMSFSLARP